MRDRAVARQLENIDVPRNVRMNIGSGIFERIADAGLCAEMDDPVDPVAGKRIRECAGIAKIDIDKGERLSMVGVEVRDARMFELDGVIGREIVDADDGFAPTEQSRRDVHSDEAGRAGNKRRQITFPQSSASLRRA